MEALKASGLRFLVLTNNSIFTPRDLRARLLASGIDVPEDAIWTSALATAQFLADQRPHGTAYVVGEAGLTTALHDIGYVMTDRNPDYVVLGETRTYSFESITRAIRLIDAGARFIATNPDASGPSHQGKLPATGSVAALISTATGRSPYFIGKPNPLMMRSALNRLEAHSETTVMVGDRMDTDIISGLEAGLRTVLVTTGPRVPRTSRSSPTGRPGSSTRSPTSSPSRPCDPIRLRIDADFPLSTTDESRVKSSAGMGVGFRLSGRTLELTGPWSPTAGRAVRLLRPSGLDVNYTLGFDGDDVGLPRRPRRHHHPTPVGGRPRARRTCHRSLRLAPQLEHLTLRTPSTRPWTWPASRACRPTADRGRTCATPSPGARASSG